eukprot:2736574-Pleurochrysis_carterae.AAC.3
MPRCHIAASADRHIAFSTQLGTGSIGKRPKIGDGFKTHGGFKSCANARIASHAEVRRKVIDFVAANVEEHVARVEGAVHVVD